MSFVGQVLSGALDFGVVSLLSSAMDEVKQPNRVTTKLSIMAVNKDGMGIEVNGVSSMLLQHNPKVFPYSSVVTEYQTMRALGVLYPTKHYVGSEEGEQNLTFVMVDDVEGAPYLGTNRGVGQFYDLDQARVWLELLGKPIPIVERPPFILISFGNYTKIGHFTEVDTKCVRAYENSIPRIVEVSLTFEPLNPLFLVESVTQEESSMVTE